MVNIRSCLYSNWANFSEIIVVILPNLKEPKKRISFPPLHTCHLDALIAFLWKKIILFEYQLKLDKLYKSRAEGAFEGPEDAGSKKNKIQLTFLDWKNN